MDYTKLANSIAPKVLLLARLINNPEISPSIRRYNQEMALREIGRSIYEKIYDMNAFDFEIEHTQGVGMDDRYIMLAKIASDSVSTGGVGLLESQLKNFVMSSIDKAQHDAVNTAIQSGKHPTVQRYEIGNCCGWCKSKVGTFTNPTPDIFARHRDCDCVIKTSGYKSRNGLLKNYAKAKSKN